MTFLEACELLTEILVGKKTKSGFGFLVFLLSYLLIYLWKVLYLNGWSGTAQQKMTGFLHYGGALLLLGSSME